MKFKTVFISLFFMVFCTPPVSGEEAPNSIPRIRYLYSIDGKATGTEFAGIGGLFIDKSKGELYVMDIGASRLVILGLKGEAIHQIGYGDMAIKVAPTGITVDKEGNIHIVGGKRVHILNYRGEYKGELDVTTVPGPVEVQSMSFDEKGNLYLGDSKGKRVIVLGRDGRFLSQFGKGDFLNVQSISIDDRGVCFLDPGLWKVHCYEKGGVFFLSFGVISSLPGGFSMPAAMAIDEKKGRILLVDTNRMMVIAFDRRGKFLFEFGGPDWFRWPNSIAIDGRGLIYVGDRTNKVRVFEVMEETPSG